MTLKLHPDKHLPAAYAYFRATEPFAKMGLPEADEVRFVVGRDNNLKGWFRVINGQPEITISSSCVGSTNTLMQTMSHEMAHLHQWLNKRPQTHNANFKKLALRICKAHGFVYQEFL